MISVELFFPGDADWTDVSSLVKPESISAHFVLFNSRFKSVIDSYNFELKYEATLNQKFYSANGKILCKIEKESVPEFTGYITTELEQTSLTYVTPLRLQAFDNSWLLDEMISESFEFPSAIGGAPFKIFDAADTANSIVHQVLDKAGYTIATDINVACPQITETIQHIAGETDNGSYRDILDGLLSEFGYVFTFTRGGQFLIVQLCKDSVVPEHTLNNDLGMITGLKTSKGFWPNNGIRLKWAALATVEDMLVHRFSLPLQLVDGVYQFTGKAIAAGDYFPADSDITDVYQNFRTDWLDEPYLSRDSRLENKDISIISTSNHQVNFDAETGIVIAAQSFEPKRAKVSFQNTAAEIKKILTAEIQASVLYRETIKEVTVPEGATNPEEYTSEYLFDSAQAEKNAIWRYRTKSFGIFNYSFQKRKSDGLLPLGTVVRVLRENPNIDTTVIIYDQQYSEHRPMVDYKAIAITAYAVENVSTSGDSAVVKPISELSTAADIINQVGSLIGSSPGDTLIPSDVVFINTQSLFRAISLTIQKQTNLTNFSHYEIAVSADDGEGSSDGNWFEPRFDGVDWKYDPPQRTDMPWVDWPIEYFLHPEINLTGTTEDPGGRTLHYRARRVTKANDKSDWTAASAQTSGTASPINDGSLAKNSVHANNIETGTLQALFAAVSELAAGYNGAGLYTSPTEGDNALLIKDAIMFLQEYTNGGWSNMNKMSFGILAAGILMNLMGCRGMIHPDADATQVAEPHPAGSKVYSFEDGTFNDQNGDAPDYLLTSGSRLTLSSSVSKFGSKSATLSNAATYYGEGFNPYDFTGTGGEGLISTAKQLTAGGWWTAKPYITSEYMGLYIRDVLHLRYRVNQATTKYLDIYLRPNIEWNIGAPNYLYFDADLYVQWDGEGHSESVLLTPANSIPVGTFMYLAMSYKPDSDTLSIRVDDELYTFNIASLLSNFGGSSEFSGYQIGHTTGFKLSNQYIADTLNEQTFWDDCIAYEGDLDFDLLRLHYLHELEWNAEISEKDLAFLTQENGKIKLLSPVDYYAPVAGEKSLGTQHDRPKVNSTTTNRILFSSSAPSSWIEVEVSSFCEEGTKAIVAGYYVYTAPYAADGYAFWYFTNNNNIAVGGSYNQSNIARISCNSSGVAGVYQRHLQEITIPLTKDRKFYYACNIAGVSVIGLTLIYIRPLI